MKKLIVSQLLLLMIAVFISSCSKDKDAPQVLLPKLDGVYIYGTNTIAADPTDPNARMSLAILDPSKPAASPSGLTSQDSVYGKFLYIGAGSTINFAIVSGTSGTTLGAQGGAKYDSAVLSGFNFSTIKDKVVSGTLSATGSAIPVTEEGLYYAYADMNTGLFILMKVRPNFIGDATFPGWVEPGIQMTEKSASVDSTVYEATGVQMHLGLGYRYRFNHGWALVEDNTNTIVLLGSLGVEDYGASWAAQHNDIGFYGPNIPGPQSEGLYTMTLVYVAETQTWKERVTRTGNIPKDFSAIAFGLEGNAYKFNATDTGGWAGSGLDAYEVKTPSKSGSVFTYSWTNVKLFTGREFIFLQDGKWPSDVNGPELIIDAGSVAFAGQASTDGKIVNAKTAGLGGDANFHVVDGQDKTGAGPAYDITLTIDGDSGAQTATFTVHQ